MSFQGLPLWPELWIEIFSYLPSPDLRNATLTRSFFCELAQPLLFQEITLYPPAVTNSARSGVIPVENSTTLRLDFVSSPRIAHAVRKITIRSASHSVGLLSHQSQTLSRYYRSSIRMMVQRLPRFPGLSTVVCQRIRWSNHIFEDLADCRQLRILEIKDCLLDLDRGSIIRRLKVHNLVLESSDLEGFPVKGWSSVIDPHRTDYIVGRPASSCLASLSAGPEIMTSLVGLRSHVNDDETLLLSRILGQSSHTLRTLCVTFTDGPELGPLPFSSSQDWPVAMPALTSYTGPVELLSLVTIDGFLGNIRHLHLLEYQRVLPHSVPLSGVLSRFRDSDSALETLDFVTISVTQDLLETVFCCHPNLKQISIRTSERCALGYGTLSLQGILDSLSTMNLPRQIATIEIYLRLDESLDRQKCCLLREKLQSKYPDLRRLLLHCQGQFVWRRENSLDIFTCGTFNANCIDGCCLHLSPQISPTPISTEGYIGRELEERRKPLSYQVISKLQKITQGVTVDIFVVGWKMSQVASGVVSRVVGFLRR